MRILGLDVGTKRIGVALSDGLFITSQGLETIHRQTLDKDLETIKNVIKENDVGEVVVGLPLNMNGTYSQKTKEVVEFADNLYKTIGIPVKTWDERLTTVQAKRVLLEADVSRRKRRQTADRLAAQIILQGYLDSRKKET